MSKQTTTRRAILAGAAALPALSLPAIATENPDAELIRLGTELRRRMLIDETFQAEVKKLRAPVDRIVRRLHRNRPEASLGELLSKVAAETPAGRRWQVENEKWNKSTPWTLACEIQAMQPQTPEGLGYYALAIAYCVGDELNDDFLLLARATAKVGGIHLTPDVAARAEDAQPWHALED